MNMLTNTTQGVSAFFYGTLMHPKILKRVIGNDGSHLQICPAVLLEYTRHQVKFADYPGILPYSKGRMLFDRELEPEEKSVRGTLVTGLTKEDIVLLDIFEGNEYTRERVFIHPLDSLTSLSDSSFAKEQSIVPTTPPPLPETSELATPLKAETYVYCKMSNLNAALWSFDDFVKNNAWKWVGSGGAENPDYTVVDERNRRGYRE